MISAISTPRAPKAIGPYSQAIKAQGFIFISGQIPINPHSGQIEVEGVKDQTRLVLQHIGAILAAEGLDYTDIVKAEVFLKDMGDFEEVNEVYASFFKVDPKPARIALEVSKLPKNAKVEISCIALLPEGDSER